MMPVPRQKRLVHGDEVAGGEHRAVVIFDRLRHPQLHRLGCVVAQYPAAAFKQLAKGFFGHKKECQTCSPLLLILVYYKRCS